MKFYRNRLNVTESVRWTCEAIGGRDESTASDGRRTRAQISVGRGMSVIYPINDWLGRAIDPCDVFSHHRLKRRLCDPSFTWDVYPGQRFVFVAWLNVRQIDSE